MIWKNGVKQSYFENESKKWWACGVCCLHFLLRKQGLKVSASEVLELLEYQSKSRIPGNGVVIDDIIEVLNLFKLRIKIKRFSNSQTPLMIDYLRNETIKGPVLFFILGHVISVLKVTSSHVHFMEPDELKRIVSTMSTNEFFNYSFHSENPTVLSLI